MTREQKKLLALAKNSIEAARLLHKAGYHGFAASRAYFAMFYTAEALLLGKGFSFSKHGAVLAAFGEKFVKTGIVPREYHRHLIEAMEIRHAGDYGGTKNVTAEKALEQIERAEKFLESADRMLGDADSRA